MFNFCNSESAWQNVAQFDKCDRKVKVRKTINFLSLTDVLDLSFINIWFGFIQFVIIFGNQIDIFYLKLPLCSRHLSIADTFFENQWYGEVPLYCNSYFTFQELTLFLPNGFRWVAETLWLSVSALWTHF